MLNLVTDFYDVPDHGFALRSCVLLPGFNEDDGSKISPPLGVTHRDDGVLTPDLYPWAARATEWFAVHVWQGQGAVQVMSRSRLAVALKWVGETSPFTFLN